MSSEAVKTEEGQDKDTVVLRDAPVEVIPGPTKVTVEEATEQGWSETEIEKAKKHGMIKEPEEEKKGEGSDAKKGEDKDKKDQVDEKSGEVDKGAREEGDQDKKNKGGIRGGNKGASKGDFELDADGETKFQENFGKGHNVHGLYFGLKAQRSRAQAAESERDRALIAAKAKDQEIERLHEELKAKPIAEVLEDEEGEDEKPLTASQWKKIQEEDLADKKKADDKSAEVQNQLKESLQIQENHAINSYEDFEKVVESGKSLVEVNPDGSFKNEINLDTLPDNARKKAVQLLKNVRYAALNADQLTTSDYTAADAAYDLGILAQEFVKTTEKPAGQSADKANQDGTDTERNSGGLTPDEQKRIDKNAARRMPSAGMSGSGGRRVVSVDNVTIDDLNKMPTKDFEAFRKNYPEKFKALRDG